MEAWPFTSSAPLPDQGRVGSRPLPLQPIRQPGQAVGVGKRAHHVGIYGMGRESDIFEQVRAAGLITG